MKQRGKGHIINIASQAGKIATPKSAIYSASKHAVLAFSNSLRMELADSGIHVTTVNQDRLPQTSLPLQTAVVNMWKMLILWCSVLTRWQGRSYPPWWRKKERLIYPDGWMQAVNCINYSRSYLKKQHVKRWWKNNEKETGHRLVSFFVLGFDMCDAKGMAINHFEAKTV